MPRSWHNTSIAARLTGKVTLFGVAWKTEQKSWQRGYQPSGRRLGLRPAWHREAGLSATSRLDPTSRLDQGAPQ